MQQESLVDVTDNLEKAKISTERCNREKIPLKRFKDTIAEYISREE